MQNQVDGKVKTYLEKKRYEQQDQRKRQLMDWGFYEKEYTDEGRSEEYPHYDNHAGKAYRLIVPQLTEEEFAELSALQAEPKENNIAIIFTVVAWIVYIGGFFLGLIAATQDFYDSIYETGTFFSWGLALSYWMAAFVSGTMFLGFSEIIKLLQTLVSNKRE